MKKGMKGFLSGAVICIIIGIIMVVIALCGGGLAQTKEIMDNGGITFSSSGVHNDKSKGTEQTVSLNREVTPDLELDLGAGSFEVTDGDGSDIVIHSQRDVDVEQNGNQITIRNTDRHTFFHIGHSDRGNDVTIEIPKGLVFDNIEMEIGAGELTCDRLKCSNLDVQLGAGQITIKEAEAENCSMVVGAGEIVVEDGDMEELDLEVGMGSFESHANVKGNLDADCGMGSIRMWMNDSENDHNYEINCSMGEIRIGNQSFEGMNTSRSIDHAASSDFDLECGMGSIEIFFEN